MIWTTIVLLKWTATITFQLIIRTISMPPWMIRKNAPIIIIRYRLKDTPTQTPFAFDCQRHFSLIKPVIIILRYPWSMVWLSRVRSSRTISQVISSVPFRTGCQHTFSSPSIVHGTPGVDVSSSPSPPSTYSPQSSPSESRTSPSTASKQQSTSNLNNKFTMNTSSGSVLNTNAAHATSHHNDLPSSGGGGSNRSNGRFANLFFPKREGSLF